MPNTQNEVTAEDLTQPLTLENFIPLIIDWHAQQVAVLEHHLTVPDGTEVVIDDVTPLTLTGDALAAYKLGIEVGLIEFRELPFKLV